MPASGHPLINENALAEICAATLPAAGDRALSDGVARAVPGLVLSVTRGGWHRLGGVVDGGGQRIAEHLRAWLEEVCEDGDVTDLLAEYGDAGLTTTRIAGRSLYFVLKTGEHPLDFAQVEIEETREVLDRPLFDPDSLPDDIEDLINPVEIHHVTPEQIGTPRYAVRRVTDFTATGAEEEGSVYGDALFRRFMADWAASSAAGSEFCDHWVLTLMPYTDRFGAHRFDVKPFPVHREKSEAKGRLRGADLGKWLHAYDRQAGHPMAWYFAMVTGNGVSHRIGEAVNDDLNGAFAYLPAKDVKVLRDWIKAPYSL